MPVLAQLSTSEAEVILSCDFPPAKGFFKSAVARVFEAHRIGLTNECLRKIIDSGRIGANTAVFNGSVVGVATRAYRMVRTAQTRGTNRSGLCRSGPLRRGYKLGNHGWRPSV